MGGDAGSMLGNIAGRVVGVLSALPSRGSGFQNLARYMAERQKAMSDPDVRAGLTPFSAGFYNIGGGMERTPAGPGYYAPVAAPKDFMGPMMPTPAGPMEYVPGQPGPSVWKPHLPALAPEAALQQEAYQRTQQDLQSPDLATRARAKLAAKIPLTPEETQAVVSGAQQTLPGLPQGSTISINTPTGTISVGSPYAGSFPTPEAATVPGHAPPVPNPRGGYDIGAPTGETEYPDKASADAAAAPRGYVSFPTSRGTWGIGPPAAPPPKPDLRPPTLPPLGAPQPSAPGTVTPQPPAEMAPPSPPAPGHVNLHAPFIRQLEAERGLPVGVMSGLAEQESGGNPNASTRLSSARGLYQITKDTARAWGISANDRYDPVKSAIATADTLAKRAAAVGITRAIGMHYGGPGAPFLQKVGPSGLSPAQFAASVLNKSQKYATTAVAAPFFGGGTAYAAEAPPPQPIAPTPPPSAPQPIAPAPAPVVVAPPPPPPPPPPQPRPAPAPVQVASAMPPENLVAYPPPAPAEQVPGVPPTVVVLPPTAGVQLQPPGGPAPILGPGGVPLESVTIESQTGEKRTFKPEEDLAAKQQELAVQADVTRLRGGGTAEDDKVLNSLYNYRTKLAELKAEFPTAADRAPYAGHPYKAGMAHLAERFMEPDPKRVAFENATAPFSLKAFETSGASMSEHEEQLILPNLPTGNEPSQARFEDKLGRFEDGLEAALAFRTTIARLPVEQRTPEVLGEVQRQVMEQQQARKAARDAAAAQGATTAPPAAAAPPPAAAPPTTPPTVVVPVPPTAAVVQPSAEPGVGAQVKQVLLPQRSFWSQLPSVGGAITGGMAGASLAAPLFPPFGPIAGGLIGAGLGAMTGEGVQVAAERLGQVPTAETGTVAERTARAGARGVAGEVLGAPLRVGSWMLRSQVGPVANAAKELAPVLAQDLPAGTKAVEAAGGGFRNIGRLLKNPTELAAAELTPEGQQTLLRAWWQDMATKKPEKIIAAWDLLKPEGQAALTGGQHAAMETVIDTLRVGAKPHEWGLLLTGASGGGTLGALVDPTLGTAVAALPVAKEAIERTVPTVAGSMLLRPGGAAMLGKLPGVAEVAGPMVSVPYRIGTQAGTTMLWPQAAP